MEDISEKSILARLYLLWQQQQQTSNHQKVTNKICNKNETHAISLPKKYWDQAEFWSRGRQHKSIELVPPLEASGNTGDKGQSSISLC